MLETWVSCLKSGLYFECSRRCRFFQSRFCGSIKACFNIMKQLNAEKRSLVTHELDEFEKYPVVVQDFRRITDCFRGIYGVYLIFMKQNETITVAWNRLDLEALPRTMPKYLPQNLPRQWMKRTKLFPETGAQTGKYLCSSPAQLPTYRLFPIGIILTLDARRIKVSCYVMNMSYI